MQQSAETAILSYFHQAGDVLAPESEVLGAVIKEILMAKRQVTNKAIILSLIDKLEHTSDIVELDIYRKTLEIVVGRTPDDIGI
ncbi:MULTISPECIES: biofilm/acid-resistance regulator YmgB/AriR [Erwinia]|uniref:biofilm/acid-resistance regulator YmgB/AriR n=1 Tax=Erwinia TaxID=551 RepID=UPI0005555671|nr:MULTISPECIES: biofilm/acid-resistance regulator YmgB/AriR [Erwinia]